MNSHWAKRYANVCHNFRCEKCYKRLVLWEVWFKYSKDWNGENGQVEKGITHIRVAQCLAAIFIRSCVMRTLSETIFFTGKAYLKITSLKTRKPRVKTPLHEFMGVARSG